MDLFNGKHKVKSDSGSQEGGKPMTEVWRNLLLMFRTQFSGAVSGSGEVSSPGVHTNGDCVL